MDILRVRLFGQVQVSHDNWKTEINTTRTLKGLLAFLLLQRHRVHSRDELATLFWGDQGQEKARGSLNTALWRLRGALEVPGVLQPTYFTGTRSGEVGFRGSNPYWLDVAVFEEQIQKTLLTPFEIVDKRKVQRLMTVLQLYRGELMEGFYDDWALRERERLKSLYLNSLAYLMRYEKFQGNYENGIAYGKQILELDPLREEIHRELIRLYAESDQRSLAVRQYKACCDLLKEELDIEPMPETQQLYAQIILSKEGPLPQFSQGTIGSLQQTLQDLQRAAESVEHVRIQLKQAIGSIEDFIKERSSLPHV